jgi:hypothetical protein
VIDIGKEVQLHVEEEVESIFATLQEARHTRLEAERLLRDKRVPPYTLWREMARSRFQLDPVHAYSVQPGPMLHYLLDQLVVQDYIDGPTLGVDMDVINPREAKEQPKDKDRKELSQKLKLLINTGDAETPGDKEGFDMAVVQRQTGTKNGASPPMKAQPPKKAAKAQPPMEAEGDDEENDMPAPRTAQPTSTRAARGGAPAKKAPVVTPEETDEEVLDEEEAVEEEAVEVAEEEQEEEEAPAPPPRRVATVKPPAGVRPAVTAGKPGVAKPAVAAKPGVSRPNGVGVAKPGVVAGTPAIGKPAGTAAGAAPDKEDRLYQIRDTGLHNKGMLEKVLAKLDELSNQVAELQEQNNALAYRATQHEALTSFLTRASIADGNEEHHVPEPADALEALTATATLAVYGFSAEGEAEVEEDPQ